MSRTRRYGPVPCKLWRDNCFTPLSTLARLVYVYLLSCEHSNTSGIFRLPSAYVTADMRLAEGEIDDALAELVKNGFVGRAGDWIVVVNKMRDDAPSNDNQRIAIIKQIKDALEQAPKSLPLHLAAPYALSAGIESGLTELMQDRPHDIMDVQQTAPPTAATLTRSHEGTVMPRPSIEKEVCSETWTAYAEAYESRYGTPPVRNAKVNSQVAQLVKRLGEASPAVARFFISHPNQYYIARGHDVGSLLMDAEKLHTEQATGKRITRTQARQTDRAGNTAQVFIDIINEREMKSGT